MEDLEWNAKARGRSNSKIPSIFDHTVLDSSTIKSYYQLRIALYLTERWREQARKGTYDEPITMQDLLDESVISIDKKHAYRFIPRIEDALHQLFVKGILGAEPLCLNPPDKEMPRWTGAWLASQWMLLPPGEIMRRYQRLGAAPRPALLEAPRTRDPLTDTR